MCGMSIATYAGLALTRLDSLKDAQTGQPRDPLSYLSLEKEVWPLDRVPCLTPHWRKKFKVWGHLVWYFSLTKSIPDSEDAI